MIDKDEFARLYPTTTNAALAARFGLTEVAVALRGSRAGLKKDEAFRAETRRQGGKYERSQEQRDVLAERNRQRTWTDEQRAKLHDAHAGKALTREHRAKISAANRGRPKPPGFADKCRQRRQSPETRAKIGAVHRGARHRNWKGGTPGSRYMTPGYRDWRMAVIVRDAFTCKQCGVVYKNDRLLHAHHLKSWAAYPELRLVVANGVCLCADCHTALHGNQPVQPTLIFCACGCGETLTDRSMLGYKRRYINGHGRRGHSPSPETRAAIAAALRGRPQPNRRRRDSDGRYTNQNVP